MLTTDANGWLSSIANPAAERFAMVSTADGLVTELRDPLDRPHVFTYDSEGRLTSDEAPGGATTTLSRVAVRGAYTVTTTSASGATRSYRVEQLPGKLRRVLTSPSGAESTVTEDLNGGAVNYRQADGTSISTTWMGDPRWHGASLILAQVDVTTPDFLTRQVTLQRNVTFTTPDDLFAVDEVRDTLTDADTVSTAWYDGATRVVTVNSAAARVSTTQLDALGRTVGFAPRRQWRSACGSSAPTVAWPHRAKGRTVSRTSTTRSVGWRRPPTPPPGPSPTLTTRPTASPR